MRVKFSNSISILIALTGLALGLRLHAIDRLSIWFDEGFTVWKIHQSFSKIFFLTRIDTVPPLYYYLLKSWVGFFGESDSTIRSLSALLGAATVPLIYLLGKTLFDIKTALMAAFLLTLSTYHIQYSQEARSYTLLLLLFASALYFLLLVQRSEKTVFWVGYAVCGTLLMYARGISLFYLTVLNLYFLFSKQTWRKDILQNWVVANTVIMVCFLPWFLVYVKQIASFQHQTLLPTPTFNEVINTLILLASLPPSNPQLLPSALKSWANLIPLIQCVWMISVLFLFLTPLMAYSYNCFKRVVDLYLIFFLPIVMIFLFSVTLRSVYVDRLFFVCLVPLSLLLAINLKFQSSQSKTITAIFLALYILCNSFSINAYYHSNWKEDYRSATEYLIENAGPGDVLIFVSHVGEIIFDWYSRERRHDLIKTGLPEGIYDRGEPDSGLIVRHPQDVERLNDIVRRGKRIWLFRNRTWTHDPQEISQKWMDEHLYRQQTIDFSGIQIIAYQSP